MVRASIVIAVIATVALFAWYAMVHGALPGKDSSTIPPPDASVTYINASSDLVFVSAPKPGGSVQGSFSISGFARGSWYFEAVFPIDVIDRSGNVIAHTQGRAQSEWATDAFVPFTAQVALVAPYSGPATVVLKKDNPSGDPAPDASLSFPVLIQ